MANIFKVTYPSGKGSYFEPCDAETIEEFCNRHFGSVDPAEHDITIEIIGNTEPMSPELMDPPPPEPLDEDEDEDD